MSYVIYTDSACDISPEVLAEWGVPYLSLTFRVDGEDREYGNGDMAVDAFYNKMKKGGVAKTAAINAETFKEQFSKALDEGKDVLYLGFSGGLSTTYQSACIAATELREVYPERKVLTVDSLCASAGQGLLLFLAVQEKNKGASVEKVAAFAENNKLHICHWFTVDDLVYLKRGGRVSPTVAFVGNMLGIKPVLHVDDEGHLVSMSKVRGRKAAIAALAAKYTELATDVKDNTVYISHGDCEGDALLLADIIEQKHGVKTEIITYVGPVIGAHSGPGTLALFFVGKER
ncbi:MAG: DegV family protein [Clostridia bacterium]|nr:DegV family protein [Clostridia bacterium]